jgi:hypothetical protein
MTGPRDYFALVNHHVALALSRLAEQRVRVIDCRFLGICTPDAEIMLDLMEQTFELMLAHQRTLQAQMAEWHRDHPVGDDEVPSGSGPAPSLERRAA